MWLLMRIHGYFIVLSCLPVLLTCIARRVLCLPVLLTSIARRVLCLPVLMTSPARLDVLV